MLRFYFKKKIRAHFIRADHVFPKGWIRLRVKYNRVRNPALIPGIYFMVQGFQIVQKYDQI